MGSVPLRAQAGSEMNVGDYYQSAYNIQLDPKLPCLNVGASGKPTYVPAELANVKRGQRKLKLDERQQAQMIREAAIKPAVSLPLFTAPISALWGTLTLRFSAAKGLLCLFPCACC